MVIALLWWASVGSCVFLTLAPPVPTPLQRRNYGSRHCLVASHTSFGCDRFCRQLDPAHGGSLSQERLPQAARRRQSSRRAAGGGRDAGAGLQFSVHDTPRDEVSGGG